MGIGDNRRYTTITNDNDQDFSSSSSSRLDSNNTSKSTSQSDAASTSGVNNAFNLTFNPINSINLSQNESSLGKRTYQRGDPTVNNTADQSLSGGSASSGASQSDVPTFAGSSNQNRYRGLGGSGSGGGKGLGEVLPALGAAAFGYLVGYALGLDTKSSTFAAGVNGISYVAGNVVAQQIQNEGQENQLIGIGIGVAGSMGGLYILGVDVSISLGIAMVGGMGGASVKYLATRSQ